MNRGPLSPIRMRTRAGPDLFRDVSVRALPPAVPAEFLPFVHAQGNVRDLYRQVRDRRGHSLALPWPGDYTLDICLPEDTILTTHDMDHWRRLPCMQGRLCIIGTIGPKTNLAWDRKVTGIGGDQAVYCYEFRAGQNYVIRAADDLETLARQGVDLEYFQCLEDLDRGLVPTAGAARRSNRASSGERRRSSRVPRPSSRAVQAAAAAGTPVRVVPVASARIRQVAPSRTTRSDEEALQAYGML
ncbi:T26 [Tupaiid betaherpesvirus 1]|uniref:T26 n=1 Tax=Tupaiid herpesvirus 1 (strain 1) TaxID=10397 RepID=Q91TS3_TUHV1|nr:T26 [Tupaiid betaherpesvirus 1]AAK57064.1 T26 [Tupaiid betaherpesvirus 1]